MYERACAAVPRPERLGLYELYIAKATEFFGIGKARGAACAREQQGVAKDAVHGS